NKKPHCVIAPLIRHIRYFVPSCSKFVTTGGRMWGKQQRDRNICASGHQTPASSIFFKCTRGLHACANNADVTAPSEFKYRTAAFRQRAPGDGYPARVAAFSGEPTHA